MKQTTSTIEVKRFEPKLESDLLKALGKILSQQDGITEEAAISMESFAIMDPSNVCMIVAKSEEAKRILSRFAHSENAQHGNYGKIPELYGDKIEGHTSKYNTDYLVQGIGIFKCFKKKTDKGESPSTRIWTAKDYPLIMENAHIKYILAPRVNNDEDDT